MTGPRFSVTLIDEGGGLRKNPSRQGVFLCEKCLCIFEQALPCHTKTHMTNKVLSVIFLLLLTGCVTQQRDALEFSDQEHASDKQSSGEVKEGGVDTSDWKVYENEEFGFGFRHPNQLKILGPFAVELSDRITDPYFEVYTVDGKEEYIFSITVLSWNLDEMEKTYRSGDNKKQVSRKWIQTESMRGLIRSIPVSSKGENRQMQVAWLAQKNNKDQTFELVDEEHLFFEQVLSTFSITK